MNYLMPYLVVSLMGSAWLAAEAGPQPLSGVATPAAPHMVVENEADYALNLRDPFNPVGYRSPLAEWQAAVADASSVSNAPPPSMDLKARAKDLLRVRGIVKRGNTYVANINGAIVRAGDEVSVPVDGQTVVFVIRAISLKRVQIEPKE